MIDTLEIRDIETRLKYIRLIQRMDQVECKFHRENLSRAKK